MYAKGQCEKMKLMFHVGLVGVWRQKDSREVKEQKKKTIEAETRTKRVVVQGVGVFLVLKLSHELSIKKISGSPSNNFC